MGGQGVIMIPRFDRDASDGSVRHGQESLVAALGIAEFGHLAGHEQYLSVISEVSADPASDRLEYLRRDLVNLALGNDDNHGRNAALAKTGGEVRLARVFDLAPMKLSGKGVARSTKWSCLRNGGNDYRPDWRQVAASVAADSREEAALLDGLADISERLPSAAATVLARASDRSAASHAMSRLEDVVRDAVAAAGGS
jgi:Uncharacterized protein related to capsule biosynthesis enzymes